jgi:hypothetical protein
MLAIQQGRAEETRRKSESFSSGFPCSFSEGEALTGRSEKALITITRGVDSSQQLMSGVVAVRVQATLL